MIRIKTRPNLKKSFFYEHHSKERSGIAMIMAVGALSVITIVTLGFSFNMQAQYKTSLNYLNALKVRYIAESGVERAVANLKEDAKARFIYEKGSLNTISNDWDTNAAMTNMALGSGKYSVTVDDEQSKININTASQALLVNVGFTTQQASDIIAYRAPTANGPFNFIDELKKIASIASIADTTYNTMTGILTVNSYSDSNSFVGRAPVNINTASDDVLTAVMINLSDDATSISTADAADIVAKIKSKRPIKSWSDFNDAVELSGISSAQKQIVKINCNPNCDKSTLSTRTTEFCFFSGGYYTIQSNAAIGDRYASRVKAIVKIYEMKNESTSADFLNAGASFSNVNASDLCPAGTGTIPNSLKIGYFDDFSSNSEWVPSSLLISGALTTNSNDIATLNKNSGKYFLDDADLISVDVSPRNDGASGFLTLPHTFYSADGPPAQTIEASVVGNRLQLTSVNCTATWDNLRVLTRTGNYVTRTYTIPTGAEKPTYATPYGTATKVDPGDGSSISLSFSSPSTDTIQVKADFANPGFASTAAVLEDIWFTYLPKAKFLYRQEG